MTGITKSGHCEIHGVYLFTEKCVRCDLELVQEQDKRERLIEAGFLKPEDQMPDRLSPEMDGYLIRLYLTDTLLKETIARQAWEAAQ